jgi:hypothetical protein
MRTTDQIFLFRSITEHWEPGSDGFIWIDVVVDGDGRVRELHLGGMHDIAPKEQTLAAAVDHVAVSPGV